MTEEVLFLPVKRLGVVPSVWTIEPPQRAKRRNIDVIVFPGRGADRKPAFWQAPPMSGRYSGEFDATLSWLSHRSPIRNIPFRTIFALPLHLRDETAQRVSDGNPGRIAVAWLRSGKSVVNRSFQAPTFYVRETLPSSKVFGIMTST
jgi:hypothetical protein